MAAESRTPGRRRGVTPVAPGPAVPAGLESITQALGALHRLQHTKADDALPRDRAVADVQHHMIVRPRQDGGDRGRAGAAEVPERRWRDLSGCGMKRRTGRR